MTDEELIKLRGEAMFACFMVTAIMSSIRPINDAIETVDRTLLACEAQLAQRGAPVEALQHTRRMLEQLHSDMLAIQKAIGASGKDAP